MGDTCDQGKVLFDSLIKAFPIELLSNNVFAFNIIFYFHQNEYFPFKTRTRGAVYFLLQCNLFIFHY